jgi:hypothetical protein
VERESTWGGLAGGCDRLRIGALYQVLEVKRGRYPGVLLAEVRSIGFGGLFHPKHFRPIYRPNADIIEQLKQPAPEQVRELITAD